MKKTANEGRLQTQNTVIDGRDYEDIYDDFFKSR